MVIVVFIILGQLMYDEPWILEGQIVNKQLWVCAAIIPFAGYIAGFIISMIAKFTIDITVNKYSLFPFGNMTCISPITMMEFSWPECRTIGLACGLQNSHLAMAVVFASYSLDDCIINANHSYSPSYGVIELVYALMLTGVYRLIDRYYFRKRNRYRFSTVQSTDTLEDWVEFTTSDYHPTFSTFGSMPDLTITTQKTLLHDTIRTRSNSVPDRFTISRVIMSNEKHEKSESKENQTENNVEHIDGFQIKSHLPGFAMDRSNSSNNYLR